MKVICQAANTTMQLVFFILWLFYPNKMNNDLEQRIKNLENKKKQVDNRVRKALHTMEDISDLVDEWLFKMPRTLELSNELLSEAQTMCKRSLLDWKIWESLEQRYKLFVIVMDLIKEIDSMVDDYRIIITSRHDVLVKQILEDLDDEKVSVSGLFGAGGVGKTTILDKLILEVKKRGVFDVVAKAGVSENVNEKRIQEEIGRGIGLSFEAEDIDVESRSDKLRQRLTKALDEKKRILIIFDNVWSSKFDIYGSIGIPKGCKIVVSTRFKDVCDQMSGTSHKVEPLNSDESEALCHKLLKEKPNEGVKLKSGNLTHVKKKLVAKCHGLPLALKTLSLVVLDQLSNDNSPSDDGEDWEEVIDEFSDNVGSHHSEDSMDKLVSQVLEASLKTIRSSFFELELFLGLCCLFPADSVICVDEIMRYGMGLALLSNESIIDSSITQCKAWAEQLTKLNLLLLVKDEDDDGLLIKVQNSIRNSVIHETVPVIVGNQRFSVMTDGNEKKWTDNITNETYGISVLLSAQGVHMLPAHIKCDMLQILRLECCSFKSNFNFDEMCFASMTSLKVLEIRNSNFWKLPPPLWSIQSLVTLCLHNCYKVDDLMEMISYLANLEVLSLRGSDISEIPQEIGKLSKLKVLDITRCNKLQKFCTGVIKQLSGSLEGLYMLGSLSRLNAEEVSTLVKQIYGLKVLQMEVQDEQYSYDQFPCIEPASSFVIKIGSGQHSFFLDHLVNGSLINPCFGSTRRVLELHEYKGASGVIRSSLSWLLNRVNELQLYKLDNITQTIIDSCVGDNLTKLYINSCKEMKYVITDGNSLSKLTHLYLINLINLVGICSSEELSFGKAFPELKLFLIHGCPKMKYLSVTSAKGSPQRLESLDISYCSSMETVFRTRGVEGVDDGNFILPKLQFLRIWGAHKLVSFFSYAHTNEQTKMSPSFFCQKVSLPEVKELVIGRVQMADIWDKKNPTEYFSKLESLQISSCIGINRVIPFWLVSSLNKLTKMEVSHCNKIEEIFADGSNTDPSTSTSNDEPYKLIQLRKLVVKNLYRLTRINLSYYVIQRLSYISVQGCPHLEFLFQASLVKFLKQLKQLDIVNCKELGTIVVGGVENEEIVLPQLQKIQLCGLNSLESFYSGSCSLKLPMLEYLEIVDCSVLKRFCSNPMMKIDTPKLTHVKLSSGMHILNEDGLNSSIKHLFKNKYFANGRENPSPNDIKSIEKSIEDVRARINEIKKELKDPDRGRCIYSDPDERKECIQTINKQLCILDAIKGKHFSSNLMNKEQQSAIKDLEALRSDFDSQQ